MVQISKVWFEICLDVLHKTHAVENKDPIYLVIVPIYLFQYYKNIISIEQSDCNKINASTFPFGI